MGAGQTTRMSCTYAFLSTSGWTPTSLDHIHYPVAYYYNVENLRYFLRAHVFRRQNKLSKSRRSPEQSHFLSAHHSTPPASGTRRSNEGSHSTGHASNPLSRHTAPAGSNPIPISTSCLVLILHAASGSNSPPTSVHPSCPACFCRMRTLFWRGHLRGTRGDRTPENKGGGSPGGPGETFGRGNCGSEEKVRTPTDLPLKSKFSFGRG